MDFLEDPAFPTCPSFGFTSTPAYRVSVVETAGGHERRNKHWRRPRHRFQASVSPRAEDEVAAVLEFYHAVGGRAHGFRFKDYVDFQSCRKGEDVSPLDQPLVAIAGATYQLYKFYTAGVLTQERIIQKPVAGTVRVADAGVEKTLGVDWTLDETTGIVTLAFSPVGALTWGGEFDVPVRFDSDLDTEIMNKRIDGCTFLMLEIRLESEETESGT